MRLKISSLTYFSLFFFLDLRLLVIGALPAGFVDEYVADVNNPIDMIFLPPPRPNRQAPMMVTDKSGYVELLLDHENSSTKKQVADFSDQICSDGARGLMGIEVHPRFSNNNNRWIYVFYTWKAGGRRCINRVSRFLVNGDYLFRMGTEQVLVQFGPMFGDLHLGSDMAFANDGNLWITSGDNGAANDNAVGQELNNLYGKLVRITPTGGIPGNNPFSGDRNGGRCNRGSLPAGQICREIYASGLRSPFKMSVDSNSAPNKVRMTFSDVGGSLFEEVNVCGTEFPAANYGWPYVEGPCKRRAGRNNLDCTSKGVVGFEDPLHWYEHDDGGGAIVGAAFVPNGLWPRRFDSSFLFSDYTDGVIYHLVSDESKGCRSCNPPASPFRSSVFMEINRAVELRFGPYKDTQALYILDRGNNERIRRIRYTRGTNIAPTAFIESDIDDVLLTFQEVKFDASKSTDPDSSTMSFQWNFGDGFETRARSDSSIVHEYEEPGVYDVFVTVTDNDGASNQAYLKLQVGQLPEVTILTPSARSTFGVGDAIQVEGIAFDSSKNALSGSSLVWEIRRHHNTHFHALLDPTPANKLPKAVAPAPEDFLASTNSYLEILLTATDASGLSRTVSRDIQPRTVAVDFQVFPPTLSVNLQIFGYVVEPPEQVVMWENQVVKIEAPDVPGHRFVKWSDEGPQSHSVRIPASGAPLVFVARYEKIENVKHEEASGAYKPFVFINCGSNVDYKDGANTWIADKFFEGGVRGKTGKLVTGTSDENLMKSRRRGQGDSPIVYNIPVPNNGKYQVKLYFVEVAKQTKGKRVFTVDVEGSQQISSYDIFAAAGYLSTSVETLTVTVDDGSLTVELVPEIDVPEISGIAVYTLASVDLFSLFLNCGSKVDYDDGANTWIADKYFKGGVRGKSSKLVLGTSDVNLMRSRRRGQGDSLIVYNIPVPSKGEYQVKLYFVEIAKQTEGKRVFTVSVEGIQRLSAYDIVAGAGYLWTRVETLTTIVDDGWLTIELVPEIDVPEVSAIAVVGV